MLKPRRHINQSQPLQRRHASDCRQAHASTPALTYDGSQNITKYISTRWASPPTLYTWDVVFTLRGEKDQAWETLGSLSRMTESSPKASATRRATSNAFRSNWSGELWTKYRGQSATPCCMLWRKGTMFFNTASLLFVDAHWWLTQEVKLLAMPKAW